MSAVVWGVPEKTGEVDDDQNDDDVQKDETAEDMVRVHLNKLFRFNSDSLTNEKQDRIRIQTVQYSWFEIILIA